MTTTNDLHTGDRYQDEHGDVYEVQWFGDQYVGTRTVRWGLEFRLRRAEINRMTKVASGLVPDGWKEVAADPPAA